MTAPKVLLSTIHGMPCTNEEITNCSPQVLEENSKLISIRGYDNSGLRRKLYFQVLSLPKHGTLIDASDGNEIISIGDILKETDEYPYTKGASVKYEAGVDFFTSPYYSDTLNNSSESFDFAVVIPLNGTKSLGSSLPVRQDLTVINVNDPPKLSIPNVTKTLLLFSSLNWDIEDAFATEEVIHRTNGFQQCRAEINGIAVFDSDRDVNYVKVVVNSTNGILILNRDNVHLADFVSCSSRNETEWKCAGSGNGDKEVGTACGLEINSNRSYTLIAYKRAFFPFII